MERVNVKGGKRLNEKKNVERRQRRKGRIKRKKDMKMENVEERKR